MKNLFENTKELLEKTGLKESPHPNLSTTERALSIAAGSYFAIKGIKNIFSHPIIAATTLALGYGFISRGTTGYCPIAEDIEKSKSTQEPVLVVKETITIDETP